MELMKSRPSPGDGVRGGNKHLERLGVREASLEAMSSSASRNSRCFGFRLRLGAAAPVVVDFQEEML